MSRVIAFGCSNTFGQALPDIHPENRVPSKFAWPALLANNLNMECYNLGIPGASNTLIMDTIMMFPFNTKDIVVVCWSFSDRLHLLDANIKSYHKAHHNIEEIVPWNKSRRTKNYYRYIYSEQHHIQMTTHFVKYVDLYLREKQIKTFFQFSCEDNYFNPLFIPIDFSKIRSKYPFALDDGHPGVGAHQELADILYQHILSKELDN